MSLLNQGKQKGKTTQGKKSAVKATTAKPTASPAIKPRVPQKKG